MASPRPMRICSIWLNSLVSQAEERNYVDASSTQLHNPIPAYTLSSLPPQRDPTIVTRLRPASKYPRITTRTKTYQSFLCYALSKFQATQLVTLLGMRLDSNLRLLTYSFNISKIIFMYHFNS